MMPIGCISCDRRLDKVSVTKARRAGWELWTGGARCPNCLMAARGELELPPPTPTSTPIVVKCTVCSGYFEADQEYDDGYKPGIHWKRSDSLPLPLCRGWDIATKPLSAGELAKLRQVPHEIDRLVQPPLTADDAAKLRRRAKEPHAEPDRRSDLVAAQEPLQPADPTDGRQQGPDAGRGGGDARRLRRRRQPNVGHHA